MPSSGGVLGKSQTSAMPNVFGYFHACDLKATYEGPFYDTGAGIHVGGYGGAGEYYYRKQGMDFNKISSVYQNNITEVIPPSVAFLVCRKNSEN